MATLSAIISGAALDRDNRKTAMKTKMGLLHCLKFYELWEINC